MSESVHPGGVEIPYDGVDQDCDGFDVVDIDGDGFASLMVGGSDCNDTNMRVNSQAVEIPLDGVDEDCSGFDSLYGMNVIIVSIDALRADHLGCYGYERNTSSIIDSLAADGILFENAFTQSVASAPSHMTMLTSFYPSVHRICNLEQQSNPDCSFQLDESIRTLPEILNGEGYRTVAFTGGGQVIEDIGLRGFDLFYDDPDKNSGLLLAWLDENYDEQFFMFFHTYSVHDSYLSFQPDQNFNGAGNSDSRLIESFVVNISGLDDINTIIGMYDRKITYVDSFIGTIFEKLDSLGISNKTIVIITSDHGEEFGEHGFVGHGQLYDETIHVPLLVLIPSLSGGKRIRNTVRTIDIMPAILDLLGVGPEDNLQGVSFAPLLYGNTGAEVPVFSSTFHIEKLPFSYFFVGDFKLTPLTVFENDAFMLRFDVVECKDNKAIEDCVRAFIDGNATEIISESISPGDITVDFTSSGLELRAEDVSPVTRIQGVHGLSRILSCGGTYYSTGLYSLSSSSDFDYGLADRILSSAACSADETNHDSDLEVFRHGLFSAAYPNWSRKDLAILFGQDSVRTGNWKLMRSHARRVFSNDDTLPLGEFYALYDLEDDPNEKEDLSQELPEMAEGLRQMLYAWEAENSRLAENVTVGVIELTPEQVERLKSLGYVI
ncbi:MAG: sulfatase [Candidatus Altiarchaeota archaeon]